MAGLQRAMSAASEALAAEEAARRSALAAVATSNEDSLGRIHVGACVGGGISPGGHRGTRATPGGM